MSFHFVIFYLFVKGHPSWKEHLLRGLVPLTPSLSQPVKVPDETVYTPPNSIPDGPITNLLSILCILIEILSGDQAMGQKSL